MLKVIFNSALGKASLQKVSDNQSLSSALFLVKLGVPQGTDAKNVCSCIFVAGKSRADCLADETLINLKPGAASPLLLDTKLILDVSVASAADPAHPGETIATVTAKPKFACLSKLANVPERVATYRSADDPRRGGSATNAPRYGCTLGGTPVREDAPPPGATAPASGTPTPASGATAAPATGQ